MIRRNAENGQRVLQPESIVEWRTLVTGMLAAQDGLNIPSSQRPKYERPDWAFVAAYLPGRDRVERALTPTQIAEKLAKHNIVKNRHGIAHILFHMINKQEAINPARRNIGVSCYGFLQAVGGIKKVELQPEVTGLPYITYAYYFNKSQDEVNAARQKFGITQIRG